jgi:hypothetical protein
VEMGKAAGHKGGWRLKVERSGGSGASSSIVGSWGRAASILAGLVCERVAGLTLGGQIAAGSYGRVYKGTYFGSKVGNSSSCGLRPGERPHNAETTGSTLKRGGGGVRASLLESLHTARGGGGGGVQANELGLAQKGGQPASLVMIKASQNTFCAVGFMRRGSGRGRVDRGQ